MRTHQLAALALVLLASGCGHKHQDNASADYPDIYFTENQNRLGDTLWYICYGTCPEDSAEKLSFVLFEKGTLQNPPGVRRVVSRTLSHMEGSKEIIDRHEGWLITDYAGTKMTQLPSAYQLNEIQDGRHVVNSEKVTLEQLKDFLDSNPERYTIDALLSFVKSQKTPGKEIPTSLKNGLPERESTRPTRAIDRRRISYTIFKARVLTKHGLIPEGVKPIGDMEDAILIYVPVTITQGSDKQHEQEQ